MEHEERIGAYIAVANAKDVLRLREKRELGERIADLEERLRALEELRAAWEDRCLRAEEELGRTQEFLRLREEQVIVRDYWIEQLSKPVASRAAGKLRRVVSGEKPPTEEEILEQYRNARRSAAQTEQTSGGSDDAE